MYQAYTLEQVLEILHAEDGERWNYSAEINERFMQSEINELKKKIVVEILFQVLLLIGIIQLEM